MSRRRLEPDLNTIAKRLKTLENKVNVADTSESEDWPVEFLDSSEDDGVADDPILEQNEEVKEEIVKIEDDTFNIPDEIRVLLGDVQDPSKNLGKKIIQELSSKLKWSSKRSQRPKPEGEQYNVSGTNNPNNYRKNNQSKKFRGKFNTDKTQFQSKMNNVQCTAAYKK
ncbi:uncharacterized protein [Choristoneura fumiferana]|uniref:uncharacterized protein n=1 Tax=Choristoneura fumiferana TaxID=7141 RepID=UPI003D15387E